MNQDEEKHEDRPAEQSEDPPPESPTDQSDQQPGSRPGDSSKTISLLDLMRENDDPASGDETDRSKPLVPPPLVADQLLPEDDEEATPTGLPIPSQPPSTDEPPLRLTVQDLYASELPTVEDEEATRVQPRRAIPGGTQPEKRSPGSKTGQEAQALSKDSPGSPVSEAPTQPPQRVVPSPPRIRIRPRPLRQMPVRERPVAATRREEMTVVPQELVTPVSWSDAIRRWAGCLGRITILSVLLVTIILALSVATASIGYIVTASQLPPPSDLRSRASTFETARILDRDGNTLYSLADPNMGNRSYVSLAKIDEDLQNATIATEDERFYTNPGFDPLAIARAVVQAAREGEVVSGASTITQQLARALLLDEEERTQRTFSRKVKEIILAAELFRTYPKDEILELYLNEIYYGNRAYGIEAAAQTYFKKPAAELSLAEASLLAGLPQAPALWDPFTSPEKALGRQRQVLGLMISEGYITPAEAQSAIDESALIVRNMEPPDITLRHPHFTSTVMQQLEAAFGAQAIYQGGLRIFTTLDPDVQEMAEQTMAEQRTNINTAGANNAAMVVVDPQTGEVLALVGSIDYNDETINGQVNMVTSPRQPGSAIKPLVYMSAMEEGWTPSTLIWDVPTEFPDGVNPPYVPKNYDDEFHGPTLMRPALGNSYNIPAVKALEFIGVCEFINKVQRIGLFSLRDSGCDDVGQPRSHGLSLALGGGEVSPLEMAGAYGVLANQGHYLPPFTISRIENRKGELIFEQESSRSNDNRVARPEHTYLISDVLADDSARQGEFGTNSRLNVSGHRVAAKTGTSGTDRTDVRDGWTIGYTPEIVTAVWVGNTDNEPVGQGQTGYSMASPIWNAFMTRYLGAKQPLDFPRPEGIAELDICADSGARPGPGCGNHAVEIFAHDQLPFGSDRDFLQPQFVDLWTNLVANESCTESVYEAVFFNLVAYGREEVIIRELQNARAWLEGTSAGRNWAGQRDISLPLRLPPADECQKDTPRPRALISTPGQLASITGETEIRGTATGPGYTGYLVDYGLSHDPQGWGPVQEQRTHLVEDGLLALFDTSDISGGPITFRLIILGPDNIYTEESDPVALEARVHLTVLEPTATPSPTPTDTPTPTNTPTATSTTTPTSTPSATPTATATPPVTTTPSVIPEPGTRPGAAASPTPTTG